MSETLIIAALFLVTAALYASVGHAGASGYLAVMGLFAFAPTVMKPTALALNVLVALVATLQFTRAGLFSWSLFWPFALASIPAAFAGGAITLPVRGYRTLVGAVLIYAAVWMFRSAGQPVPASTHAPAVRLAIPIGAVIGLLSGLSGVGGGIFLSPLLVYAAWADPRAASGVAAPFILVNSLAGLLGHLASVAEIPRAIPLWGIAVLAGGWLGATYGSRRAPAPVLRRLLAVVLVIAGAKLILF